MDAPQNLSIPDKGYFAGTPELQRSQLTAFGSFVRPEEGETLISEGHPQDALYLILSGSLEVFTEASGQPLRLSELVEGDAIGEINLFDPGVASATVRATENSVVWRIRRDEVDALLKSDPETGIALLKSLVMQLSARVRVMNRRLAAQSDAAEN